MSTSSSDIKDHCDVERAENPLYLDRMTTAGGHVDDRSQPALPVVHRSLANPAPLGFLSFATGIFLISAYGVNARGVTTPNVLVGVLIFFGGVCQLIAGIMEFVAGNTFGATVFPAYGAFNLSYATIYIPGSGILAAYTDAATGALSPEFDQALAVYLWAWFIMTVIVAVASVRSSWVLFADFVTMATVLLLLATGYITRSAGALKAGFSLGFVVAFLTYWVACAGLWAGGITPIVLPTFSMYHPKGGPDSD